MWSYLIAIMSIAAAPWAIPVGVTIFDVIRTRRQRSRDRKLATA